MISEESTRFQFIDDCQQKRDVYIIIKRSTAYSLHEEETILLYKALKRDRQLQNICININIIPVDTYSKGKIKKLDRRVI